MRKKKFIFIGLGLVLGIAVIAYIVYLNYVNKMKEQYGAYDVYTGHIEVDSYQFINDGDAVVTHLKEKETTDSQKMKKYGKKSVLKSSQTFPIVGGSGYIILYNEASKDSNNSKASASQKGEYKELMIYKQEGNRLKESKLDLLQLEKETGKGIFIYPLSTLAILKNGNIGLNVDLGSNPAYIDLSTHKIVSASEANELSGVAREGTNDNAYSALMNGNSSSYKTNRFSTIGFAGGSSASSFNKSTQSQRDKVASLPIASKYPKAYQLLMQENSYLSMLVDYTQPDIQADSEVLGLFNKDGQTGVFKELPISKENAVDGQEHVINSYDEFMQYYNPLASNAI